MLKIRLKRYGRKKQPCYRIIVIDSRKRRDGQPIEEIGFYNPITKETTINIEKVNYYTLNGAQITKTVNVIYNKVLQTNN
uniref:Small ribosomal subunit protein bS16c n=1 Tax=Dichotomaria marginata TaxID=268567 RepID=A0A1G4NSJ0_9FLOR|nr:Ribosomal protein S16 [Dichotomaria marginata]SCW21652.1 Ribosomal protein S16 [Dichotomaria marginata]